MDLHGDFSAAVAAPVPAPEAAERRFELGATDRGPLDADLVDGQVITKRFARMAIFT
ncbi:hypothetical protein [Saccharothrix lopnurensis]|uniref:Uncharacterized protein n=1 Tax=Saccharothrix lopnurensis TaxID=1670621 RepID=A0ABW1PDP0_9PSEU